MFEFPEPMNMLSNKRNFADKLQLRFLRQGYYSGLFGWAQYNHVGLYKRVAEEESQGDVVMEAEVVVMGLLASTGRKSHDPRNAGASRC